MVHDLGDPPRPVLAALAAAERVLSKRAGAGIVLADPEDLGGSDRSVVARARVARNPFSLPRTLVVKHYVADPAPDRPDPFHYEVASCQLFTALPADDRSSPVLIAHDPDARLLVLEDLGRSSTLADKLFGPDADAAQRCLLGWARALGRMQAATAGRESDFGALLRRQGERAWRDPMAEEARAALAGVPGLLDARLGVRGRRRRRRAGPRDGAAARRHPLPGVQPVRHLPGQQPRDQPRCPVRRLRVGLLPRHRAGRRLLPGAVPGLRGELRAAGAVGGGAGRGVAHGDRRRVARARRTRAPGRAACSTRRCCGSGCAPGGCCRGCPSRGAAGRDAPIGPDAARSPRISTALAHYWQELGTAAADGGRGPTAELAAAVVAALRKRFPDAPERLARLPRPALGG